MEVFSSKIDTWVLLVLIGIIAITLITVIMTFREGGAKAIVGLVAGVIGVGLPLWVLIATHYSVDDETLLIRSGPFNWEVPVASITAVKETRNSSSSPALSLDRLRIEYGSGETVLVSPEDKEGFKSAVGYTDNE